MPEANSRYKKPGSALSNTKKNTIVPITKMEVVLASWMSGGANYPITAYFIEGDQLESVHFMEFIHR